MDWSLKHLFWQVLITGAYVCFCDRWFTWKLRETVLCFPPCNMAPIPSTYQLSCWLSTASFTYCWQSTWIRCYPVRSHTPQKLPFTLKLPLGCIVLMLFWYECRWVWNEEVPGVLPEAVLLVQKQKTLCGSQFSVWRGGAQHSQGGRVRGAGFLWVQRKRSYLVKVLNIVLAYAQKCNDVYKKLFWL